MDTQIYLNGTFVREEEARVSIWDIGFMYGAVFMEAARTFRHRLFRLDDHLERMERSLRYAGLGSLVGKEALRGIVEETVERNLPQFAADDDCWVCWQVTPGRGFPHPMMKGPAGEPTVMAYVSPLPYDEYYRYYLSGKPAVTTAVANVPPSVVDPRGKTRFRLHYFMAKIEALARDPEAFALLLDTQGFLTEGTGANLFLVRDGVLYTPTTRCILEGISRRVVLELAAGLGLRVVESDLTLYDAYTADEAFWTTSSYCMLPCQRINHVRVRQAPGPVFAQLMEAWSKAVGVDIIDQARRYHTRPSNVWRGAGAATLPATQDPRT